MIVVRFTCEPYRSSVSSAVTFAGDYDDYHAVFASRSDVGADAGLPPRTC